MLLRRLNCEIYYSYGESLPRLLAYLQIDMTVPTHADCQNIALNCFISMLAADG